MNKEVLYITNINYKNCEFKIFMVDGRVCVIPNADIDEKTIEEVKLMVYDKNRIMTVDLIDKMEKKDIYKILATEIIVLGGILIGTYIKKDLDTLKFNDLIIEKEELTISFNEEQIKEFDEELFVGYVNAIYSNENLSIEDKRMFVLRFEYINENIENVNKEELYNTLKSIKIVRHDEKNGTVLGNFVLDLDGTPIINLYKDATDETLIHEIYHALKFNKFYWDDVYFYETRFINSEEYNSLPFEEQLRCQKKDILGNMLEEAHTTVLTAKENNTENVDIAYKKEVYLYKMYEKIIGQENLEKFMLDENQIIGFLNCLLELGCTKEEAVTFTARLDLYNYLTYNKLPEQDLSYLYYQICDDLAYVYEKKFGHTNDMMLDITILSVTNNINTTLTNDYYEIYNMPQLYNKLSSKELTVNNYLNDNIINDFSTKYGINDIYIDYFSNTEPKVIIEINNYDKIVFDVVDNKLVFSNEIIDNENVEYIYQLYSDYYEYAINRFNDEEYAAYYASIYANVNLTIDQKAEYVEIYHWLDTSKITEDEINNVLLLGNSKQVNTYFAYINNQNVCSK